MDPTTSAVLRAYFWTGKPFFPDLDGPTDSFAVLALGRGMYADSKVGGVIHAIRATAGGDDFLALKILYDRDDFNPSRINVLLGREVINHFHVKPMKIFAQWENAYGMFLLDRNWTEERIKSGELQIIWPDQRGYLATAHIAMAVAKAGYKAPLLFAHPAHMARVVPTFWAQGLRPVVTGFRRKDLKGDSLWIWDAGSVQPWTTSFFAWQKREIPARWVSLAVHLVPMLYHRAPEGMRKKLPEPNWIAFRPPKLLFAR